MEKKDILCKLLCDTYLSCTYTDVIKLYHSYLDFYLDFGVFLLTFFTKS